MYPITSIWNEASSVEPIAFTVQFENVDVMGQEIQQGTG